ncbi:hypothetical protein K9N50_03260 [bacterium]|nr:hypothetical protein [bacterium]
MKSPPELDSLNLNELLILAKDENAEALEALMSRLEPGLATITMQYLPHDSEGSGDQIISEALEIIKQHIKEIRASVTGYARSILLGRICDELLQRAKNGNRIALNNLLILLRVRLGDDPQLSKQGWGSELDDDVLQESCIVFFEKATSKVHDNPYLYFKQIVMYKLRDKLRLKKADQDRFVRSDDNYDDDGKSDNSEHPERDLVYYDRFDEDVERRDLLDHILKAIRNLSEFCREFFKSMYQNRDEKQWRELTQVKWNLSESALNTRIHRCRHNLKIKLENRGVI